MFLRIAAWTFGGLVLLLAVFAGIVWFAGGPVLAWALRHPVSSALGRQIRIGGGLRLTWGRTTVIEAKDVEIANAGWSHDPDMLTAKRIRVEIVLASLLDGPIRLPSVALDGTALLLETSTEGRANWRFGAKSGGSSASTGGHFPEVNHLLLRRSDFRYRNGETGAETRIRLDALRAATDAPSAPLDLDLAGSFQEMPIRLSGTVGNPSQLLDPNRPYPIRLSGGLDKTRLTTDGTVKEIADFSGVDLRLSLEGEKLEKIASALGVPIPSLPPYRATAKLTGGKGKWSLQGLSAKLGKSDAEGGIDIDMTGKVPGLHAQLTSSLLDLADVAGPPAEHAKEEERKSAPPAEREKEKAGRRVIPNIPISVHQLPGVDAVLSLDAARVVRPGGVPVERVVLGLMLRKGELTFQPLRFQIARGDVDLNLHFTPFAKAGPPRMRGRIDIRHVDLHKLLSGPDLPAMFRKTSGTLGGFAAIDTNGTTLREFLARMSGNAGIFVGNGSFSNLLQKLAPIDALEALGIYVTGDEPIKLNCMVSRFDIRQGVASSSTLLLDTSATQIQGSGRIDFGAETLSVELDPKNKSFTLVSLRAPVTVGGPLGKPNFAVKKAGLIGRAGVAVAAGILFPPAAILPLIDLGLGATNSCSKAFGPEAAAEIRPSKHPAIEHSGSSVRPGRKTRAPRRRHQRP